MLRIALVAAVLALACSASPPPDVPDASTTGSAPDAGDPPDAGEDATTPDAGEAPDAGNTFDPCHAAGLSVCDSFEGATAGGAPDPATWATEIFDGQGALEVVDDVAHGGTKSVHVDGSGNGSFRYVMFSTRKPFPTSGNAFWVRFFLRSATTMGEGHSSYFSGQQVDWGRTLRLGFQRWMLEANLTHPTSEWEVISGPWTHPEQGIQLVPGRWHCVEAHFDGGDADALSVFFDGAEVSALHTTDWGHALSDWAPTFEVARFGFETYHGEVAELWYDDVAIGSARIGCE